MNPNQPQYPPPAGAPMPGQPGVAPAKSSSVNFGGISLTDAIIGVSGLLVFFLSFAPLYSASIGSGSINSWQAPYSPVSTWVALAGLIAAALAALSLFLAKDRQILGFTRGQLLLGVTLFMVVEMFGFLFATPDYADFGAGGWIMLLFSLAALVFAVLGHLGKMQGSVTSTFKSSSTPAAYPGAYQPPAGGYQPPPAGYTQPAQPGYQPGAYPPPGQPGQYPPPPGQG